VIGDALRLRAALENLIDNAVKFTEHGSVRLDVTCERAARGKERLIFTVTDSGIGLTAAEIKRLFRPFAQASEQVARNYGGAGLGLTFVKRIAKAMGGDLAVMSEPGRGSRFRMSVTVDKVAEAAATAPSEGAAASRTIPTVASCSIRSSPNSATARISSAPARRRSRQWRRDVTTSC
jgi:signal transduction histidine kinase